MPKFLVFDLTEFPVVHANYQSIVPSLEEFVQSHTDTELLLAEHSDFVLIIDLTNMPFLPLEYRLTQAKWNTKAGKIFVARNVKFVFHTPSPLAKMLLKAMLVIIKPPVPYVVASNFKKARALAKWMIQSEGKIC